ncbi:MAG: segregation/condensation protein A [Acidobacteriota bacterium]
MTEESIDEQDPDPGDEGHEPEFGFAEATESETGYKLQLPSFQGPLDLLLHLIRQHKIDVNDIPILLITEQYTSYLNAMEELDLEVAADYVYMAALLIHIKSKMLLPRDEDAEGGEEDPRSALVDRLVEYQRFRSVAESFAELDVVRMGVWSRPPLPAPGVDPSEMDMSDVSLFDLIDAFRGALTRYKLSHPHSIELKRSLHKISEKMSEIVRTIAGTSPIRLLWYLEGRERGELIAIFLGMLELVRLGGLSLRQSSAFEEILIYRTDKELEPASFAMFDQH